MKEMKIIRDITQKECPWLDGNIESGCIVYIYYGPTYGCIGPNGIAVTSVRNVTPFFEVPKDSIKKYEE